MRGMSERSEVLDVLRGVAILLVLGDHFLDLPLGWSGVDLFFVLSGYLLGGILIRNREATGYWSAFYGRRAARILPIYAAATLLGLLIFGLPRPLPEFATFTQNIGFAFHPSSNTGPLALTWSLAVEEQFYLMLPLIVRLVPRRRLAAVALCCAGLAILCRMAVWIWLPAPLNTLADYRLMPCRMDALFLGVFAAAQEDQITQRDRIVLVGIFGAMLLLPVMTAGTIAAGPLWSGPGYSIMAAFYASGLLAVRRLRCPQWLVPLRWLGVISYGVYLFHGFAMHALPHVVALPVTVLGAAASWMLFECRITGWARRRWAYEGSRKPTRLPADLMPYASGSPRRM